jgi:hypothetical protein
LGEYLGRGVWPFLALLIVGFVWIPVFLAFIGLTVACLFGLAAVGGKSAGGVLVFLGILFAVAIGLLLIVGLILASTPFMLRAGITQDFGRTFDFAWASDFLKKTWTEVLLASLFLVGVSIGLSLLTCGLGTLVVWALAPLVQVHFWHQLYAIYLARGGTPVPAKLPLPNAVF